MWTELLEEHKGPMLFGEFSIADAYFAPVCMRLKTYALPVPADITAYIERVCALPGVKAWIDDALAEKDFVDFDEPYRTCALSRGRGCPQRAPYTAAMQTYMVGGAVRDALLGLPVNDRDWVVVGATPQEMIDARLPAGGQGLPGVPASRRRARSTRWRAPSARPRRGYHGFAFHAEPDVTLEQDLARRDLTINAMAQDESGRLIDPFGGQARPASAACCAT